jgi:hypothetical protein
MAWNYYQGVDGGWAAGNWSLGAAPADAGEALVPASGTTSISGTDQKGIYVAKLIFDTGFIGNIGTNGDPLIIDGAIIHHKGSGTLYLKSDDNASGEYTDWVLIDSDAGGLAANLDGEEMTRISVLKGRVELAATLGSVTLPALVEVAWRDNQSIDAHVTIACALLAATGTLVISGGQVFTTAAGAPSIVNVNQSGGLWDHGAAAGGVTTYNGMGGRAHWKPVSTLATANIHAGCVLDLTQNSLSKVITTCNLFSGGEIIWRPDVDAIGTLNRLGGKSTELARQDVRRTS